ncbi:MAG: SRPBCC family protein [Ilumatobacteraceae bacterium]|nr:SRPBCC family protein [Ilumatobacteraceae bacterium]
MPSHPEHPPEWIDAAPVRVEQRIEIDAPVEAVWARIADHETWPEWFAALDRVEVVGRGSGVGGGRRVTAARLPVDEVFTAWDENEHFAFAIVRSKLPILQAMAESVRLEETDNGGCRVIYVQGLEARRGFGRVLGAVSRRLDRDLKAGLDALKQTVESTN